MTSTFESTASPGRASRLLAPYRPRVSPRWLSLGWSIWAMTACLSYLGTEPSALDPVSNLIPGMSLALMWALVALVLFVGAVLPPRAGAVGRISLYARLVGVVVLAALLAAWGATYLVDSAMQGGGRMWVSGKNYAALAIAATASAAHIARHKAPPKEVPQR